MLLDYFPGMSCAIQSTSGGGGVTISRRRVRVWDVRMAEASLLLFRRCPGFRHTRFGTALVHGPNIVRIRRVFGHTWTVFEHMDPNDFPFGTHAFLRCKPGSRTDTQDDQLAIPIAPLGTCSEHCQLEARSGVRLPERCVPAHRREEPVHLRCHHVQGSRPDFPIHNRPCECRTTVRRRPPFSSARSLLLDGLTSTTITSPRQPPDSGCREARKRDRGSRTRPHTAARDMDEVIVDRFPCGVLSSSKPRRAHAGCHLRLLIRVHSAAGLGARDHARDTSDHRDREAAIYVRRVEDMISGDRLTGHNTASSTHLPGGRGCMSRVS